jgi:hypothetical protein
MPALLEHVLNLLRYALLVLWRTLARALALPPSLLAVSSRSARCRSTAPSRAAHALGYLSIDSLWLYKKNKSVIGAQQSVPTGPVVIDQNNIGDIVDEVKAGLR